jgi:hypothetical protein
MTCSVNTIASLFSLQFMLNSSLLILLVIASLQLRHIWKGKASLASLLHLNQNQVLLFSIVCIKASTLVSLPRWYVPLLQNNCIWLGVFLQIFEANNIKSLISSVGLIIVVFRSLILSVILFLSWIRVRLDKI